MDILARESSKYIGISIRYLRGLTAEGEMKHSHPGSRIILLKQDFDSNSEGLVI